MTYVFKPAVREQTPIMIGLVGPSGSGKTYSALRLATGIQTVAGGSIAAIDTESRRMLHYASKFKFDYLDFGGPFTGDRYLEAVQAAVEAGARTIIVDSMSHEHEGPGGHLEFHDEEVQRLVKSGGFKNENAAQIPAWNKPAARRRRMINGLLQVNANLVFCFRAKEKIRLARRDGKIEPVELGWQAIAGEEFVYEMTDRILLPAGAMGVPDFSREAWATGVPKMPEEHSQLFGADAQLDEATGAALARWALGTKVERRPLDERHAAMVAEFEDIAKEFGFQAFKDSWEQTSKPDRAAIGIQERDRIGLIGQQRDNQQPPAGAA